MTLIEKRFAARVNYVMGFISMTCFTAAMLWSSAGNRLFAAFTDLPVFAEHPLAFSAALHLPVWFFTAWGCGLGSIALVAQALIVLGCAFVQRQQRAAARCKRHD